MGRKKKKNKNGYWVHALFYILITVLAIVALATPLIILVGFLYNSINAYRIRKNLTGTKADFWLNSEEKAQFKKKSVSLPLTEDVVDLRNRPIARWDKFNSYVKNSRAFIATFFSWAATLLYYFVKLEKQSVLDVFLPFVALPATLLGFESDQLKMVDGDIIMIAVATIVAIGAYFLFRVVFKNDGEKYTPKPEQVSLDNIDDDKYWKSSASEKGKDHTSQKAGISEKIAKEKLYFKKKIARSVCATIFLVMLLLILAYLVPNLTTLIPKSTVTNPTQQNEQPTLEPSEQVTNTNPFREIFINELAQYESEVEPKVDDIRLSHWAGEKYAELQDLKTRAIEDFSRGDYLPAREGLRRARTLVAQASAEYDKRLAAAMRDAQEAFDDDRAPEAEKAVREALRLNPLDAEMLALEKRIAVMPRVLDLLRRAAVAQNENRPEKEATALREALSLDPSRKAAESRLKTLRTQLKQQRFAGAVRGAQRALDAGDLAAAEQHIALAKNISPASAELGVLQKRLAQARTERAFAAQLSLGEQAKARDDWPVAEKHFERARQLKPDDKTAVENHDLAARVVGATEKIRRTLDREHRLGDQSVLDSVAAYLREVEALAGVSPGLQKLHGELARKVDAYQTEVDVVVVSDNKTHIIVRGVGQVGKTARRTIRLRPGRRVFEGSRSGYQSKLVTVDLVPGAPAVEVSVVCDEKI